MNAQLANTYLRGRKVHIDRVIYCYPHERVQKGYLHDWVAIMGGTICKIMNESDVILADEDFTVFDKAYEHADLPVLSYKYVHDCATTGNAVPVNEYLVKRYTGNKGRVLVDGGLTDANQQANAASGSNDVGREANPHWALPPFTPPTSPIAAAAPEELRGERPELNIPHQGLELDADAQENEANYPPIPTERLKTRGPFNDRTAVEWGDKMLLWYLAHTQPASPTDTIRGTSSIMTAIVSSLSTHTYENAVGRIPGLKPRVKALIKKHEHRAGDHVLPRAELHRLAAEVGHQYDRFPH